MSETSGLFTYTILSRTKFIYRILNCKKRRSVIRSMIMSTLGELVLFKSVGLFKQRSYNNLIEMYRFVVLYSVRYLITTGSENDSEKSNHINLRNINYGQQQFGRLLVRFYFQLFLAYRGEQNTNYYSVFCGEKRTNEHPLKHGKYLLTN